MTHKEQFATSPVDQLLLTVQQGLLSLQTELEEKLDSPLFKTEAKIRELLLEIDPRLELSLSEFEYNGTTINDYKEITRTAFISFCGHQVTFLKLLVCFRRTIGDTAGKSEITYEELIERIGQITCVGLRAEQITMEYLLQVLLSELQ